MSTVNKKRVVDHRVDFNRFGKPVSVLPTVPGNPQSKVDILVAMVKRKA